MKLPYKTYRSYLKSRFGKPVLKIPVNAGFSCPNRDGTIDTLGCSFCDNPSFSPVAESKHSAITQTKAAIDKMSNRFEHFLVYLQPFTNTYAAVSTLKDIYEPLVSIPKVVGLAIGTRPDCLSEEVCDYLMDLSQRTYLNIEVGLQSASDKTLRQNNRGHSASDFTEAIIRLSDRGIETTAHIILGLPGDTIESMHHTAEFLAKLPVQGIKIHQLMIIRGTPLEKLYREGSLKVLSLKEYATRACDVLKNLAPSQYIHRLMADSKPEFGLIAPLWSANKMKSLAYINAYIVNNI